MGLQVWTAFHLSYTFAETEPARKKQRVENGKARRSTSTMDVTNKSASKSATKRRIFFTEAERQAVEAGFLKEIRLAKVPGKPDVVNFVKQNPTFSKYPWTKIKFAVHNMINARKRKEMDSA
ncbi:uncharacterized protein LOC123557702 [Mercenaria mercenaria]|uniref:uncharacterized protein LOC123557702 n=1 Tax=Mercenaria mercenaria TaxID=6596 RepID=UPI00234EB7AE|nr:uncharacterized protein LOC123557702 [Mercenaria mercenaria]